MVFVFFRKFYLSVAPIGFGLWTKETEQWPMKFKVYRKVTRFFFGNPLAEKPKKI